MVRDIEQKTIADMTDLMSKVLRDNGINPMQALTLVGYAARQLVTDISHSICINPDYALIMSLGAMLPEGYLREFAASTQRPMPSNGSPCVK